MPRTVGNATRIMVNVDNSSVAATTAAVEEKPVRTVPFSPEQLQEAWRNYIREHQQERAMITTMSYALPKQVGDDVHYEMIVGSPTEQKNVEERKKSLLKYLCDALQNDQIALDVKVSDVPIDTPKILSPREVVEQIKQHNPNFTQFLKDFDLGLA